MKGRPVSQETKDRIRAALIGRKRPPHSSETKAKISAARRGKKRSPHSEEAKKKISISLRGRKQSPELIEKRASKLRGRKRPAFSDEWKMKISLSRRGKPSWKKGIVGVFHHSDETKKKIGDAERGPKHYHWLGGISKDEYGEEFNRELRLKIMQRDSLRCFVCGEKYRRLAIHHIDFNKKNNGEDNLVTLCCHCHGRTQVDRDAWTAFFQDYFGFQSLVVKENSHLLQRIPSFDDLGFSATRQVSHV